MGIQFRKIKYLNLFRIERIIKVCFIALLFLFNFGNFGYGKSQVTIIFLNCPIYPIKIQNYAQLLLPS